jgi:hypothetical protein
MSDNPQQADSKILLRDLWRFFTRVERLAVNARDYGLTDEDSLGGYRNNIYVIWSDVSEWLMRLRTNQLDIQGDVFDLSFSLLSALKDRIREISVWFAKFDNQNLRQQWDEIGGEIDSLNSSMARFAQSAFVDIQSALNNLDTSSSDTVW